MDTIIIRDLEVWYQVGVPDQEREEPQRLQLTLEMTRDFTEAAAGDDLTNTIDYYAVSRRLVDFGRARTWKLIETLAVDIARMVLEEFGPESVTVEVKKFILPETRHVAVRVARRKDRA